MNYGCSKILCWRELCWQELCCRSGCSKIYVDKNDVWQELWCCCWRAAPKILRRLYVGSSTIWNNVCHISKNHVDNRQAENWHRVATDNLCRIYYKLKQGQTGLIIEITNHIRIYRWCGPPMHTKKYNGILLSVGGWDWKLAICRHVAIDRGTCRWCGPTLHTKKHNAVDICWGFGLKIGTMSPRSDR